MVTLTLHNTYWTINGSSNSAVLRATNQQTTAGTPTCHGGPPGTGCGTTSQSFKALSAGVAHITAQRTTCGEALQCSPSPQRYDVTIRVVGS
jgi:hypothetical protein